ncbi:DNA-directed RNA polymerase subunit delta [Fructilactobacillus fructivorans]|uniref:Probable DNA-directed RNA polymerase subunit delta n=1 Tax=Fructilactobacillus fructivorans TaxID=1614 RepID=A0A0C1PM76_9LACO|nr:DNA-directed RNA polymerase delta subunit [Fructilactobacillus fructivorans]KRK57382.1 DNA-directed RNA polymerase subunit delta [Fructilactobacillus fructivorans]KRN41033.1 DNA-directed RNA polymerase subunit delta [Fructilactobacillus fructivorans]KRN42981.1 DNA-directed RNA polymerase subunit delta [Fructilactobacillus fructivorans]
MVELELKELDKQDKSELSMVEVAHAILADAGKTMSFVDLTNEVQKYLGDSNQVIRDRLPQFYTDLNVDGSFISLGNNVWGLRTWYPYESINEATINEGEEDNNNTPKKHRKVNAFMADAADDDDVIDYDNDDPEDQDDFEDSSDDDKDKYHKDLDEENPDTDDDAIDDDDGVEGDLSEVDPDDHDDKDNDDDDKN